MGAERPAARANLAIARRRGCSGCTPCKLRKVSWVAESGVCGRWRHTLAFLVLLHVFLCKTELLALGDVQVDFMPDVCDYRRALDMIRMG
jgi:hypothetical protein